MKLFTLSYFFFRSHQTFWLRVFFPFLEQHQWKRKEKATTTTEQNKSVINLPYMKIINQKEREKAWRQKQCNINRNLANWWLPQYLRCSIINPRWNMFGRNKNTMKYRLIKNWNRWRTLRFSLPHFCQTRSLHPAFFL